MKTLIIEDEKAALRNLKAAMKEVDAEFEIVGETDSVTGTLEWFAFHPMPDLVFMDIHLADGSAFGIFEQTDITCPIIFTTAYDEYALQAFKVNSIAYLLKPISSSDLQQAIDKLKILGGAVQPAIDFQAVMHALKREESYKTHFLVPVKGDRFVPVGVEQISYFISMKEPSKQLHNLLKYSTSSKHLMSWLNNLIPGSFSEPIVSILLLIRQLLE